MKTLALIMLALCGQAMAQTFNFSSPQTGEFTTDQNYVLTPEVSIGIGSVMFTKKDEAKVYLSVNGKGAQYPVKILKGDMFYFGENKYEVVIKTDVLKDVICDERETVSYMLTFTEEGEYDHFNYVTGAQMKAVKAYTYDSCHAYTEYSEYNYEEK